MFVIYTQMGEHHCKLAVTNNAPDAVALLAAFHQTRGYADAWIEVSEDD
jgi:hypothetical protein